jgi:phosphoribosylanthranilate isomerase
MTIDVKICGIMEATGLEAAVNAGARYVGFVFEPGSSRYVAPKTAGALAKKLPKCVTAVGLFVDPDDDALREATEKAALGLIQLHGRETPERVTAVRALTGLPVMKVFHIATAEDFAPVAAYESVADLFLFDTKIGPQPTGGTGKSFNWNLLKGRTFARPWMLAGGLKCGNVAEAVATSGARIVDVSSGVEDALGRKDPAKIRALLRLAATL